MPLIPDTMNPTTSGGNSQDWMSKLMGKKIGDNHTETSFAKKDLPTSHRVMEEGGFGTMDHKPERLNIHTDKDGVVKKVTHG